LESKKETIMSNSPVTAVELRQLLKEHPETRILDVRTGGEFESLHIPGSYNVPLDNLAEHARSLAAVDCPVVLVCQSGGRASTAQGHLNKAGKTNIRVLEGGVGAWMVAEGDVVRGAEKWSLERQVRLVAGSIVFISILLSLWIPNFKWLAGAIGFGLTFAALSNTCMMGMMLAKLPYNRGPQCRIDEVLDQMQAAETSAA
jgi:rhodanese-related sulfurtransferase